MPELMKNGAKASVRKTCITLAALFCSVIPPSYGQADSSGRTPNSAAPASATSESGSSNASASTTPERESGSSNKSAAAASAPGSLDKPENSSSSKSENGGPGSGSQSVQIRIQPPVRMETVHLSEKPVSEETCKAISEMELKCFGSTYVVPRTTDERLERLEQHVFGMSRLGDYQARIDQIKSAFEESEKKASVPAAAASTKSSKKDVIRKLLGPLELKCFGHENRSGSIDERLEELELLLFGMARLGSYQARLDSIKMAIDAQAGEKPVPSALIPALCALEKRFYQGDFSLEPEEVRLMRLEKLIFGDSKQGDAAQRLQALQKAVEENQNRARKPATTDSPLVGAPCRRPGPEAELENGMVHDKNSTFAEAMATGIANFKLKRFQHAREDFEQAISFSPGSPQACANLGSTLMLLKDYDGAQEAFKAAFTLEPFGQLAQYVHKQLINLAHEDAYRKTAPQDTPQVVTQTISTINRQAAESAQRYYRDANATANHRIFMGDLQAQRITRQSEQDIADLRYMQRGGYHGAHYRSRYASGYDFRDQAAEISNIAAIRRNYILTDAQTQANRARLEGSQKSNFAYESATNLKDQILAPVKPGSAQLKALGTSLYARYYGTGVPSTDEIIIFDPPPPELHAVPKQLPQSTKGAKTQ